MFDADTAALLRSAPDLPETEAVDLPIILTQIFAALVATRLRGDDIDEESIARLAMIADAYELITVVSEKPVYRRPSAFVAATAQQILSKVPLVNKSDWYKISREQVSPAITAPLLFLIAEQYPDANEAANALPLRGEADNFSIETLLTESVRDLAKGNFIKILEAAARRSRYRRGTVEAATALYGALLEGVELLAAELLNVSHPAKDTIKYETAKQAFRLVISLCSEELHVSEEQLLLNMSYPGPAHLARLLRITGDTLADASVMKLKPPKGASAEGWYNWLSHRAKTKPIVWPNHREVLAKHFEQTGTSALLTLPTGAGKTTVAEFKIAGALARGKSVVFLVPTHALKDQLVEDLAEAFPDDVIGTQISDDFDLFAALAGPPQIEVMTPEMCLTRLALDNASFLNTGLMVFDECHLLSPSAGSLRRALDGMLAILGFQHRSPDADFLFLSAMIRDGSEFGEWIGDLTSRKFVIADPIWKPSRQARGVLCYPQDDVKNLIAAATAIRTERGTKGIPKAAEEVLDIVPFALFGLQHNWNLNRKRDVALVQLLSDEVRLAAKVDDDDGSVYLTSNANAVSSLIAAKAAGQGLKTIMFVTTAQATITNAERIQAILGEVDTKSDFEKRLWEAVGEELGMGAQSIIPGWYAALPHSAWLLPIERKFVENLYRRTDGASVVVATTTLSQGMNLPSELAIISGDKRSKTQGGGREALKAHEVLNAAGRAGRAGHLANGVVLLVPEAVLTFSNNGPTPSTRNRLKSIMPESDRCIDIDDPLTAVLDQIQSGSATPEANYLIHKLHGDVGVMSRVEDIRKRSFGAFIAKKRNETAQFEKKISSLEKEISKWAALGIQSTLIEIAAQRGYAPDLLQKIDSRLQATKELPEDVAGWLNWTTLMFQELPASVDLLGTSRDAVHSALGIAKTQSLSGQWAIINNAMQKWIAGAPLKDIEVALGGSIADDPRCSRAREIATDIAPKGFCFTVGLLAQLAKPIADTRGQSLQVLDYVGAAVRRGYNTHALLQYSQTKKGPLSRVQFHKALGAAVSSFNGLP